jgi:hypothetical protein
MSSHKGQKLKSYTKSQKIELVSKFVSDELVKNLSRKKFAEDNDVNYKTFCDWVQAFKRGELHSLDNPDFPSTTSLPGYYLIEEELIRWTKESILIRHFITWNEMKEAALCLAQKYVPNGQLLRISDGWMHRLLKRNNLKIILETDDRFLSSEDDLEMEQDNFEFRRSEDEQEDDNNNDNDEIPEDPEQLPIQEAIKNEEFKELKDTSVISAAAPGSTSEIIAAVSKNLSPEEQVQAYMRRIFQKQAQNERKNRCNGPTPPKDLLSPLQTPGLPPPRTSLSVAYPPALATLTSPLVPPLSSSSTPKDPLADFGAYVQHIQLLYQQQQQQQQL